MSDPGMPEEYGWPWSAVLLAALVPLLVLCRFVAPQTDDFCYAAIALQRGFAGIWEHYQEWSGRLVASTLIPLPAVVASVTGIDLFVAYGFFVACFLLGFAILCYWLIGQLLPHVRNPSRSFFALALFIALTANAPTTRHMVFWMPGAFTYTLPAFLMLSLFTVLSRALADGALISRRQLVLFAPAVFLAALCNELSGPITVVMLGLSLPLRRHLAAERAQTAPHVLLIAVALLGTAIVYVAPGNVQRAATVAPGGVSVVGALAWGALYVPAFLVVQLPRPGVLGWFALLIAWLSECPAAAYHPRRARVVIGFALVTLLASCWVAFVAGYYGQGGRLPERAQNPLFLLSIVSLSFLVRAAVPSSVQRPRLWWSEHRPGWLSRPRVRMIGVGLLLLSPALLVAMWQLPQAPRFRHQARAQLLKIRTDPGPISYVAQVETQPVLLFNNRLSADGREWPNRCLARFLRKEAVIPEP